MSKRLTAFWSVPTTDLFHDLQTSASGLTAAEAQQRLARYGLNRIEAKSRTDSLTLFVAQFKSPIILILLFAAGLSLFLHDPADASIIIAT
jgi:Mg2+-importing ATPase